MAISISQTTTIVIFWKRVFFLCCILCNHSVCFVDSISLTHLPGTFKFAGLHFEKCYTIINYLTDGSYDCAETLYFTIIDSCYLGHVRVHRSAVKWSTTAKPFASFVDGDGHFAVVYILERWLVLVLLRANRLDGNGNWLSTLSIYCRPPNYLFTILANFLAN